MLAKHLRTPFLTEHLQWLLLKDVQKAPETPSDCLMWNPIYILHQREFWRAVLASSFIKVKKMIFFFIAWVLKQIQISLRERRPNTEFFLVCIQSESRKIRTRKNSVFGHFSRSVLFRGMKARYGSIHLEVFFGNTHLFYITALENL